MRTRLHTVARSATSLRPATRSAAVGLSSIASLLFGLIVASGVGYAAHIDLEEAANIWLKQAEDAAAKDDWPAADLNLRKYLLAGLDSLEAKQLYAYVLYKQGKDADAAQRLHQIARRASPATQSDPSDPSEPKRPVASDPTDGKAVPRITDNGQWQKD